MLGQGIIVTNKVFPICDLRNEAVVSWMLTCRRWCYRCCWLHKATGNTGNRPRCAGKENGFCWLHPWRGSGTTLRKPWAARSEPGAGLEGFGLETSRGPFPPALSCDAVTPPPHPSDAVAREKFQFVCWFFFPVRNQLQNVSWILCQKMKILQRNRTGKLPGDKAGWQSSIGNGRSPDLLWGWNNWRGCRTPSPDPLTPSENCLVQT